MAATSKVRLAIPRQTADTHASEPKGDATVEAADRHTKRFSWNSRFSCEIVLTSLRANLIHSNRSRAHFILRGLVGDRVVDSGGYIAQGRANNFV